MVERIDEGVGSFYGLPAGPVFIVLFLTMGAIVLYYLFKNRGS